MQRYHSKNIIFVFSTFSYLRTIDHIKPLIKIKLDLFSVAQSKSSLHNSKIWQLQPLYIFIYDLILLKAVICTHKVFENSRTVDIDHRNSCRKV